MKIECNTKFSLGDVAWTMYNNKPVAGIVYKIQYDYSARADIHGSETSKFWRKLKNLLLKKDEHSRLLYDLISVDKDGKFECVGRLTGIWERELYNSKEELLESL